MMDLSHQQHGAILIVWRLKKKKLFLWDYDQNGICDSFAGYCNNA